MLFQDDLEKLKSLIEKPLRTLEEVEASARRLEDAIEDKNPAVVNDLIDLCEQSLAEVKGASSQIQEIKRNWGSASSSDYFSRSGKQNDPRTKEQKSLKGGKVYLGQNLSAQADDSDRKKNPNLDKPRNHDKIVDDNIKTETNNITHVKLEDIHYCQASVSDKMGVEVIENGRKKVKKVNIQDVIKKMKTDGWDYSQSPPDMVIYPCGKIVTVDHRRVVAARLAGIERIPANIHTADERLLIKGWVNFLIMGLLSLKNPPMISIVVCKMMFYLLKRFPLKKDFDHDKKNYKKELPPETWREAAVFRAAKQREMGYEKFPLDGTAKVPEIRSSKNQKPKNKNVK